MRKYLIAISLTLLCACGPAAGGPIVYNGDTLEYNREFKRMKTGMSPSAMPEISGMSCSRVTPGFLWAQSDDNYRVIAMTESGTIRLDILLRDKPRRADWEDMCSGVWNGQQTLFIGAFGDNSRQYADQNYIFYLPEPEIPDVYTKDTFLVGDQYIRFGYPDSRAHDAEAMFFDEWEQVLYIVDKVDRTCASVYALPMDTAYGTDLVRLTKVGQLGLPGEWQFQRVTAADLSPCGRWLIIKNYDVVNDLAYALLWERQGEESLTATLLRQPQQIYAYQLEWQGEAVAWLDSTTFYTTSDEDGSAPIYKYVRWGASSVGEIEAAGRRGASVVSIGGQLFVCTDDRMYTIQGQRVK